MFGFNKYSNTVIINGERIITNGQSIVINNGSVIVDGRVIKDGLSGIVELKVEGDLMNLNTTGSATIHGNVHGNVDTNGSVTCHTINGDVDAMGSVKIMKK